MSVNEKSLKNLKPPVKGEIRNPKGYPKGVPNSKTRLLKILSLAQNVSNEITGQDEVLTIQEQMDIAIIKKALSGDIIAYREVLDRLEGKAMQGMEITGKDGEAFLPNRLTPEQITKLVEKL